MEATAYSIKGKTASGVQSGVGKVAVDPSVIKLGTKLYIQSMDSWPSYGSSIAADTGSYIKGNRIDLFFNSRKEAINFGRRKVKVYIKE